MKKAVSVLALVLAVIFAFTGCTQDEQSFVNTVKQMMSQQTYQFDGSTQINLNTIELNENLPADQKQQAEALVNALKTEIAGKTISYNGSINKSTKKLTFNAAIKDNTGKALKSFSMIADNKMVYISKSFTDELIKSTPELSNYFQYVTVDGADYAQLDLEKIINQTADDAIANIKNNSGNAETETLAKSLKLKKMKTAAAGDTDYSDDYYSGYSDGFDQGMADKTDNLPQNPVAATGSDDYKAGYQDGYTEGYSTNYSDDYYTGYNDGFDKGLADKQGNLVQNPDAATGSDDYKTGYHDGYTDGYNNDTVDDYYKGYSDGYEQGTADKANNAPSNPAAASGSDDYKSGYQDGYNDGYSDDNGGTTPGDNSQAAIDAINTLRQNALANACVVDYISKLQNIGSKCLTEMVSGVFSNFETGLIKKDGNQYIIEANLSTAIDALTNGAVYAIDNYDKLVSSIKTILTSLSDDELKAIGIDPAQKDALLKGLDSAEKPTDADKTTTKDEIKNQMASLKDILSKQISLDLKYTVDATSLSSVNLNQDITVKTLSADSPIKLDATVSTSTAVKQNADSSSSQSSSSQSSSSQSSSSQSSSSQSSSSQSSSSQQSDSSSEAASSDNSSSQTTDSKSDNPKTGDSSRGYIPAVLLGLTAASAAMLIKKKNSK